MFFVVYSIRERKFLVVPVKWVKNHQKVFEKSVNYSINSNQIHRCFFSNNINENGETGLLSDFRAPIANDEFSYDHFCFYGLLVTYFGKNKIFSIFSQLNVVIFRKRFEFLCELNIYSQLQ